MDKLLGTIEVTDQAKAATRGGDVLRFLDHHRLSHQPDHYAFAYAYLTQKSGKLKAEVDRLIDGGVRLTQAQVSQLSGTHTSAGIGVALGRLLPDVDHVTLRVLDVVGEALNATGEFSRSLVAASASLATADSRDVSALVSLMVERTERAEASLSDTARRVRDLRTELRTLQGEERLDLLTGLLNRAALEDRLGAMPATDVGCCFALVDVNGLRRINDGHSHAVGDRLLKIVAATLNEICAPHAVGRWDGGTFAVVLDADLTQSTLLLYRACHAVATRRMRVRENDAPLGSVAISAGVVAARRRGVGSIVASAITQLQRAKDRREHVSTEQLLIDLT